MDVEDNPRSLLENFPSLTVFTVTRTLKLANDPNLPAGDCFRATDKLREACAGK